MNPLNQNDTQQQARDWSGHLGELAAEQPSSMPAGPSTALGSLVSSAPAGPSRLVRALNHFVQRQQRSEDAEDKLRAAEFILAP